MTTRSVLLVIGAPGKLDDGALRWAAIDAARAAWARGAHVVVVGESDVLLPLALAAIEWRGAARVEAVEESNVPAPLTLLRIRSNTLSLDDAPFETVEQTGDTLDLSFVDTLRGLIAVGDVSLDTSDEHLSSVLRQRAPGAVLALGRAEWFDPIALRVEEHADAAKTQLWTLSDFEPGDGRQRSNRWRKLDTGDRIAPALMDDLRTQLISEFLPGNASEGDGDFRAAIDDALRSARNAISIELALNELIGMPYRADWASRAGDRSDGALTD
jgi:hypothetical protein